MEKTDDFYTNLDSDFFENLKVAGTLSKNTNSQYDNYAFMQKNKKDSEEFFAPYNTFLFLGRRYTLFTVFFLLLLVLFSLSSPVFALGTFMLNFLYYLVVKPFETRNKIAQTSFFIKIFGLVAFVVSMYFLFSNTLSFGRILDTSQGLLYSFMFTYVAFHALGLVYKYKELYIRLENQDEKPFFSQDAVFLWKDK